MIQTKQIRHLSDYELYQICIKHDCEDCPLAIIVGAKVICLKNEIKKVVKVEQTSPQEEIRYSVCSNCREDCNKCYLDELLKEK